METIQILFDSKNTYSRLFEMYWAGIYRALGKLDPILPHRSIYMIGYNSVTGERRW